MRQRHCKTTMWATQKMQKYSINHQNINNTLLTIRITTVKWTTKIATMQCRMSLWNCKNAMWATKSVKIQHVPPKLQQNYSLSHQNSHNDTVSTNNTVWSTKVAKITVWTPKNATSQCTAKIQYEPQKLQEYSMTHHKVQELVGSTKIAKLQYEPPN